MNWGRTLLSLYFFLTDADLILNSDVLEILKELFSDCADAGRQKLP